MHQQEHNSRAIVAAIASPREPGMKVVAAGVETEQQWNLLG
ncbi:hypothetical protein [Halomonas sp.]